MIKCSLLFTFDTKDECNTFVDALNKVSKYVTDDNGHNLTLKEDGWEELMNAGKLISKEIEQRIEDPPLHTNYESDNRDFIRMCAVFVSGTLVEEGKLDDMNVRFQQEVDSHSGSVEIREMRDGKWHTIRRRMRKQ